MPTPIENLTTKVNEITQQETLQKVADNQTARRQAANKFTAISAITNNAHPEAANNFFGGIAGDATAEDLLTENDSLIDEVAGSAPSIEGLNESEEAIKKAILRREGFNPDNYASLSEVMSDDTFVSVMAIRESTSNIARRSLKAQGAIDANESATLRFVCEPAGLDPSTFASVADLASTQSAMGTIAASQLASRNLSYIPGAMADIVADSVAYGEFAANMTGLSEMAQSRVAMDTFAGALPAFQAITSTTTQCQTVVAESEAMRAIAANTTARDDIEANNTAITEMNALTEPWSHSDGRASSYRQIEPLTRPEGVWVEVISTGGSSYSPRHRLNQRGITAGTSTNLFVYDAEHDANTEGGGPESASSSGDAYFY